MQTYFCGREGEPINGAGEMDSKVYRYPFKFVSRFAYPAISEVVNDDDEFLACLKLHATGEDVFLHERDMREIVKWATIEAVFEPKGRMRQASCVDPAWHLY